MHRRARTIVASLASILLGTSTLTGCGGSAPSASSTATPSPTPQPIAFSLEVLPTKPIGLALPGEKFVFLVRASGATGDGAVEISATASGGTVSVEPASLQPGAVGEVTLVPSAVSGADVPVDVEINAERGGILRTETRTISVQPGTDDLQPDADAHLAPFITWLAANRPDLGITLDTPWERVPGTWVLIVSHSLYFSSDWELDLAWHVMVAPYDWSRVNMRRRWSEMRPSCAFEISSVTGRTPPHEIEPEDAVWR